MSTLDAKELFKTFYRSQRSCRNESGSVYVAYKDAVRTITDAFCSIDKDAALTKLFHAQCAANSTMIEKRKPSFSQSEQLQIALANFRGVIL